jgi:hypothetical protein
MYQIKILNRYHLPRQSIFILTPSARTFLTPILSKRIPVIIRFCLVFRIDDKRNRFIEFEQRACCQNTELHSGNFNNGCFDAGIIPGFTTIEPAEIFQLTVFKNG